MSKIRRRSHIHMHTIFNSDLSMSHKEATLRSLATRTQIVRLEAIRNRCAFVAFYHSMLSNLACLGAYLDCMTICWRDHLQFHSFPIVSLVMNFTCAYIPACCHISDLSIKPVRILKALLVLPCSIVGSTPSNSGSREKLSRRLACCHDPSIFHRAYLQNSHARKCLAFSKQHSRALCASVVDN